MTELRLSVRALVEFTLHGEDISPAGATLRDFQEGMLGHKARQAHLGADWQAEVPLSLTLEEDDARVLLSGRMDAYRAGILPAVEEIKLWQGREAPQAPYPAHRAQAVCYAHMLCATQGVESVDVRVVYVTRQGRVRGEFREELSAAECREAFLALWLPWLRRTRLLLRHRGERDASLSALRFPFPAYRPGQREMAAQVYTAVRLRRRLFAEMPTGTGKSAAALFPALKALGAGLTEQVFCLTARNTQRAAMRETVALLRRQPLNLWALTLDAKDRQCPESHICHPDHCPRAKGHYLRDAEAVDELLGVQDWTPEVIREAADRHRLCPFELSLSLAEAADVILCDYNYALDPAVHIQRIFDAAVPVTLLIDEAHNLPSRLRDMLGGRIDLPALRRWRTAVGKAAGRRHPLYKALGDLVRCLAALPAEGPDGRTELPDTLDALLERTLEEVSAARRDPVSLPHGEGEAELIGDLYAFLRARRRDPGWYAWIREGRVFSALALEVGGYFREATAGLRGVICFSGTLQPLPEMRRLLGGEEEDACFAMPSPFPPEHLRIRRVDVNTRYAGRERSVPAIAEAVRLMTDTPGKYLVFFPSFQYLEMVSAALPDLPHRDQTRGMTEEERSAFLAPYREDGEPVCSFCVLGGLFSESVDLPGRCLDGVAVVGVGLPQVNLRQELLRAYLDEALGDGFLYAYMIPGMQKVAQAVGRLIRAEEDRGTALLIDDRYRQRSYLALCPPHWRIEN